MRPIVLVAGAGPKSNGDASEPRAAHSRHRTFIFQGEHTGMNKPRSPDAPGDAPLRDGYDDAFFAYAEQWLRLQDAAVSGMLAGVEPIAMAWWNDLNGAAGEWTRFYFNGFESALEQMREIGDAVARNQQRLLEELRTR
jgi:hypothetical protein